MRNSLYFSNTEWHSRFFCAYDQKRCHDADETTGCDISPVVHVVHDPGNRSEPGGQQRQPLEERPDEEAGQSARPRAVSHSALEEKLQANNHLSWEEEILDVENCIITMLNSSMNSRV